MQMTRDDWTAYAERAVQRADDTAADMRMLVTRAEKAEAEVERTRAGVLNVARDMESRGLMSWANCLRDVVDPEPGDAGI